MEQYLDDESLFDYRQGYDADRERSPEDKQGATVTSNNIVEPAIDLGVDEEVVIRQTVSRPKLDVPRLLAPQGLIKVKTFHKKPIAFRGKGHEYEYLERLLERYQLWGHELFPKMRFIDILGQVEKLGHARQLRFTRKEWIDEWKPVVREEDFERDKILDFEEDEDRDHAGLHYDDGSDFLVADDNEHGEVEDNVDEDDDFMKGLEEMNRAAIEKRAKVAAAQALENRQKYMSSKENVALKSNRLFFSDDDEEQYSA
ncbi:replication fork protection component Swi3-domain-containing protein [Dipodascopsis uninucleata]